MPRLAHLIAPKKVKLSIPQDLYDEISARLHSPRLGAREYGALSALVCALLREWNARQTTNSTLEQRTNDKLAEL